jgi:hypothetical protein
MLRGGERPQWLRGVAWAKGSPFAEFRHPIYPIGQRDREP